MASGSDVKKIKNSALWAAYGDALGFISERVTQGTVQRRTGTSRIKETVPWQRHIGGPRGPLVDLPAGTYSDDTQLRLATCRCIRYDGSFDVDAFSKIELPVWQSYALGAGRASKVAAAAYSSIKTVWTDNFFQSRNATYLNAGGNGAAMRIQPHVWSAIHPDRLDTFLLDVIKNTICTHGHPRALLGAVFHSSTLAIALTAGVASPDVWLQLVRQFARLPDLIANDESLSMWWLPQWERHASSTFTEAWNHYIREFESEVTVLTEISKHTDEAMSLYEKSVEAINAKEDATLGSGTKTALLAALAAWVFRNEEPLLCLETIANVIGTDTDTIGTMAGALVGASAQHEPPGQLLDRGLIANESVRMRSIRNGQRTQSFIHPDLLKWKPPRSQLDAIGTTHAGLALMGLGPVTPGGPEVRSSKDADFVWQWMTLPFGQNVLAKRRVVPRSIHADLVGRGYDIGNGQGMNRTSPQEQLSFEKRAAAKEGKDRSTRQESVGIERAVDLVIQSGFDPTTIGKAIKELSRRDQGVDEVVAFAALIARAIKASKAR